MFYQAWLIGAMRMPKTMGAGEEKQQDNKY